MPGFLIHDKVSFILQHEYMSYMEKKTTKRQTTIITLSDHNKQEIRNIELQKEIMEEEFDDKEKGELQDSKKIITNSEVKIKFKNLVHHLKMITPEFKQIGLIVE